MGRYSIWTVPLSTYDVSVVPTFCSKARHTGHWKSS